MNDIVDRHRLRFLIADEGMDIILRCAAMPKNRMDDPLEGILVQNEQRMRPIIITIDPMEEVLSAYERE